MVNLDWQSTEDVGVFKADLGPTLSCWRIDRGASFGDHGHTRPETFVVLTGAMTFSDSNTARAGTVIQTSPGERHAATALEETIFLVATYPDAVAQH